MTTIGRWLRVIWPIVFFVPLTWIAGKYCKWPPIDPIYHSLVWLHERLFGVVALISLFSILTVIIRFICAQSRLKTVLSFTSRIPPELDAAIRRESSRIGAGVPAIAYLDIPGKVCCTVSGPTILVSRGFLADLDERDLDFVIRHELLHVAHRDPLRGLAWHLAFAFLPLPNVEAFERWLHDRRERRTNLIAGRETSPSAALCAEPGSEEKYRAVFFAPAAGVALILALLISHALFSHDLPYLLSHHC